MGENADLDLTLRDSYGHNYQYYLELPPARSFYKKKNVRGNHSQYLNQECLIGMRL